MSDMPKRDRSSTSPPSTQPSSPVESRSTNAELEQQLARLNIDEEFKDSIRSMTPNTQREVLNDVVRSQQVEQAHQLLPDMDTAESEAHEGPTFRFILRAPQDDGAAGDDILGEEEGRMPQHPLAQLLPLLMQARGIGPDSANASPQIAALQAHLMNMVQQLNEMHAMRTMGIDGDIDNMSYEELLDLEERMGSVSKGLKADQIARFITTTAEPTDGSCAVCLGEWPLPKGEKPMPCVKLNACSHVFHEDCITHWLESSKMCPVCKQEVTVAPSTPSPAKPATTASP